MHKTIGMMRIIAETYATIRKLIALSSTTENPLSWNEISLFCKSELDRMGRMKEFDPLTDEAATKEFFDKLSRNFKQKLIELEEKL